jgi:hypothetical protein
MFRIADPFSYLVALSEYLTKLQAKKRFRIADPFSYLVALSEYLTKLQAKKKIPNFGHLFLALLRSTEL